MTQYLEKSALVAEIEKRLSLLEGGTGHPETMKQVEGVIKGYKSILSFLDTLKTKEVNLDKEFEWFLDEVEGMPRMWHSDEQIEWAKDIARHFYELGLRTKDVNEIIKTAEDHAYFAGSENTREKLIDKACEWLSQTDFCHYYNKEFINDFRKAMEE